MKRLFGLWPRCFIQDMCVVLGKRQRTSVLPFLFKVNSSHLPFTDLFRNQRLLKEYKDFLGETKVRELYFAIKPLPHWSLSFFFLQHTSMHEAFLGCAPAVVLLQERGKTCSAIGCQMQRPKNRCPHGCSDSLESVRAVESEKPQRWPDKVPSDWR